MGDLSAFVPAMALASMAEVLADAKCNEDAMRENRVTETKCIEGESA